MIEKWKDVVGYEGLYQVSNIGSIKSLKFGKEKLLKQSKSKVGYLTVVLYKNGKQKTHYIHKLVAMSFLNHKPSNYNLVIDHVDNNKENNNLTNLQIITHRKNASKDKKGYTSDYIGVFWCNTNKKWVSRIRLEDTKKHLGYFQNEIDAHLAYQKELNNIQAGFKR